MPNLSSTLSPSVDLSVEGLAAIMKERITHGQYRPGSQFAPERVLAAEFGVSRRSVRLAYDQLMLDGLIERNRHRRPVVPVGVGDGLVYAPATVKTIAAVLPINPVRPDGLATLAGIHRVLVDFESHCRMQVFDTYHANRAEMIRLETKALDAIADQDNVDGLICWCYGDDKRLAGFLRDSPRIATVFIDRRPCAGNVDFVGIDDVESARTAVDSLFDLGHERIAHVMDPGKYSTINDRAAGYRAAHAARGVPVDSDLLVTLDWSADRIERTLDRLFALDQPPTAVFASSDFIAYELVAAAESRGIGVPRDLSVMGHGNIDRFTPRQFMSTVEQPFELIGRNSARLLLRRLQRPPQLEESTQHIILQAPLIIRQSCASPVAGAGTHRLAAAGIAPL